MARHRRQKKVFNGQKPAPARTEMRFQDGEFTVSLTANGWTHTRTVNGQTASEVASACMPADDNGKLASLVRAGIDASMSAGKMHLAIRLASAKHAKRATRKARNWLDWLLRQKNGKDEKGLPVKLFPGLRIREFASAPQRTGKIILSKRFASLLPQSSALSMRAGFPVVEFTRSAGRYSPQ